MKIFKNGKLVEVTSRNDLHNTYSVKNHKPAYQGKFAYKGRYQNQLNNNKILLWTIGLSWLLFFLLYMGTLKVKNTVIDTLQHEVGLSRTTLTTYADQQDFLLTELASCSAELKLSKLSKKAQLHMKQQPEVANKIISFWGNEWVEAMELYSRESSLKVDNVNPSSGACGLVQFLPCSKLKCSLTDLDCQLVEGKKYIASRYGSPMAALFHHDMKGWY